MVVDFSTQLVDLDGDGMEEAKRNKGTGEVVFEGEGDDAKPVMLKLSLARVAKNSLMASFEDEKNLDADAKLTRWNLAQKINRGAKNYSVEDVALVKKLIAKAYGVQVVGPALDILEGDTKDEE